VKVVSLRKIVLAWRVIGAPASQRRLAAPPAPPLSALPSGLLPPPPDATMNRYFRFPLLLSATVLGAALIAGCAASDPNVEGARLQLRNGDFNRVIELTDRAIEADPTNVDAHYLRGEGFRGLAEQTTDEAERSRHYEQMATSFARANELDPTRGAVQLAMIQAYGQEMNRGAAAFRDGAENPQSYRTAAQAFANAARVMPDSTDAYLYQGLALLSAGETAGAADPLRAAIDRGARAPEAYLYLGRIYLSEDRADDAIAVLEQAHQIHPDDSEIETELLNTYARTGQSDRALTAYEAAVQRTPDDAVLRYNYGSFLLQAGRYDEATQQLTRATELDVDNANAYYNLGAAYINQAVEYNQQLADISPTDPEATQIQARRDALLAQAVDPLERARALLTAQGIDATDVCQSLFRAYAQLRRNQEAQSAAECAGIDLN
jgi:tetratricopeptide (TPR) repeat protein